MDKYFKHCNFLIRYERRMYKELIVNYDRLFTFRGKGINKE